MPLHMDIGDIWKNRGPLNDDWCHWLITDIDYSFQSMIVSFILLETGEQRVKSIAIREAFAAHDFTGSPYFKRVS